LLPPGDWIKSAKSCLYNKGILTALLKNDDDKWVKAKIKVNPDTIVMNKNGEFVTEQTEELKLLPEGNWIRTA
jgi:hypothetical protein